MGKTISFVLQKGGVGKSTTTAITARLLADEGSKVLCVDFDSQGNLTLILTGHSPNDFKENSVFEAIVNNDVSNYIMVLEDNIDYIAANKYLSLLEKEEFTYDNLESLKNTLAAIKDEYDYILIDLPPALGHLSLCGLIASDYCVIPTESASLAYHAIEDVIETIETVKANYNPDLKVSGVLRTLADSRRKDNKYYIELIKEKYPTLTLETVVKRTAAIGRLPDKGITQNDEIRDVVKQHKDFIKELHENGL